jgi:cysteinyl-tRNA synthetase
VLNDDFSTPDALAVFHQWRRLGDTDLLKSGLDVFGLATLATEDPVPKEVHALAGKRSHARLARDFEAADRLRAEIEARGWQIRDVDEAPGYQLVPK